jgi:hypothetical protein
MQMARASESSCCRRPALAQFRRMAVTTAGRLDMADQMQVAGTRSGPRFE